MTTSFLFTPQTTDTKNAYFYETFFHLDWAFGWPTLAVCLLGYLLVGLVSTHLATYLLAWYWVYEDEDEDKDRGSSGTLWTKVASY